MGGRVSATQAPLPPVKTNLIAMDKAMLRAAGRYTATRSLESDYVVESKVVGSGLSGPVRLATAKEDGQKCAVKSFKKKGLSANKLAELKNEAEVYLALDHPHVARLEMIYETQDEAHLVMEYMEGGELFDRLEQRQQYSEEAAAQATHQMLLAVAYLHAQGIAHRDLKLQNFLYERKDTEHLKIIDFGFAKFVDHNTRMSQACGSIDYVAPEVLMHSYTEKADLWSMGVIAFMLLTGAPPFFGSDEEVLSMVKIGAVHWSSRFRRLSQPAKEFLKALLVPEPALRLSAQQALDHEWLRCRSHTEETFIDDGILNNLRDFARASQFKRSVLYMMAWSTSTEDRMQLRKDFLAIDHDNSGKISLREFKAVLEEKLHIDGTEAKCLFKSLDMDNSDEIEYSEFLAAALQGHLKVHEGVLRKTFARFDANGDGLIDQGELASILGESFSAPEIEELIREADTSGDGKLDHEEFLAYFHKPETEDGARKLERRTTEQKLSLVIAGMRNTKKDVDAGCALPVMGHSSRGSDALQFASDSKKVVAAKAARFPTAPSYMHSLPTLLFRATGHVVVL